MQAGRPARRLAPIAWASVAPRRCASRGAPSRSPRHGGWGGGRPPRAFVTVIQRCTTIAHIKGSDFLQAALISEVFAEIGGALQASIIEG
eukprot:2369924-Pyramimonas_sp.AAC.1